MEFNHKHFEHIHARGFRGFLPVSTLMSTEKLNTVPQQPGVYLVLNPTPEKPKWLSKSVGGHFKGKDPTVNTRYLEQNWVKGATTLYVGETQRTLYKRVSELIQFGSGRPVGHKGGRLIWQLENNDDLLICWLAHNNPIEMKNKILREFKSKYNALPFANLRG